MVDVLGTNWNQIKRELIAMYKIVRAINYEDIARISLESTRQSENLV